MANHIRDDTCLLPDGHLFTITDFHDLLVFRGFEEFTLGYHLKQFDLDCQSLQRQNVASPKHILSEHTAQLFEKKAKETEDPDEKQRLLAIAKMCRVFCKGYRSLTSHEWTPQEDKLHCPLGMFYRSS